MKTRPYFFLTRIFAVWISLSLTLPAYALRTLQPGNNAGLEDEIAVAMGRSSLQPTQERIPGAGLEELPRDVAEWRKLLKQQAALNQPLGEDNLTLLEDITLPGGPDILVIIQRMRQDLKTPELEQATKYLIEIVDYVDDTATPPAVRLEAFNLLEGIGWVDYGLYRRLSSQLKDWGAPDSRVEQHARFRENFDRLLDSNIVFEQRQEAARNVAAQLLDPRSMGWRPFGQLILTTVLEMMDPLPLKLRMQLALFLARRVSELPDSPEKEAFRGELLKLLEALGPVENLPAQLRPSWRAIDEWLSLNAETDSSASAGLEEDSLKEWFGISNEISKVWLGRTAHRLLPMSADWVGFPETDEWWNQVATANGEDGLRLLLGLGDAPNRPGSRDFGAFIILVKKGQKLSVYQDSRDSSGESSLIGTITPGQILTVGRSSPEMEGRITEQARPDGKYLSAKRHLTIRWEEGKGIFLVDRSSDKDSGKGTWMDASLVRQLFPGIPFSEKWDLGPNKEVDLELWSRSASVPVLERRVFGNPPVPMLEVSRGENRGGDSLPESQFRVHMPEDENWWNAAQTTNGLHVVAGIARDNPNDVSQKIGPVLLLEMEGGRIWIYQVVETEKQYGIGAQPTSVRKLVGSVGPGEEIVIGRNSLPGFGKIEESNKPPTSSRQHFSVRWETGDRGGIVIEDQGSGWGTYLFKDKVAEILEAVERQEFQSPLKVELVYRGGRLVAAERLPSELVDWVTSRIAVTLQQVWQLYHNQTVVTREGKRHSLAFLPGDPASLGKLSGRKLFVQKGMFPPEVLKILERRNEVFELEPSWAELMVGVAEELASTGKLKPVLITTPGSMLDEAMVRVFSRYAEREQQKGAEWNLPIAMVSVPTEIAIGEWPVENIVEYLLDLIRRVDGLPGRTGETLRAFERHGKEIRVLIELA